MKIESMTWLEEDLQTIRAKIHAFDLGRSVAVNAHFEQLAPGERDNYMRRSEEFWFTALTIVEAIDSMILAVHELEALRSDFKADATDIETMLEGPAKAAAQTRELYGQTYTLLTFLRDLGWLDLQIVAAQYPELRYIWLLRNKFIVHPPSRSPLMFEAMGTQMVTSADQKLVPYVVVGPPGWGLTYYWKFFSGKAGINPDTVDTEKVQQENKKLFLKLKGWNGVAQDDVILSRIKAFGLAPVDQKQLGDELKMLFDAIVIPRVKGLVDQAVIDKVLIRT